MAARMGRHREAARRGLFALKKQMPPRRASPGKFVDWWGGDQPVYSLSAGWRHKSWIVRHSSPTFGRCRDSAPNREFEKVVSRWRVIQELLNGDELRGTTGLMSDTKTARL